MRIDPAWERDERKDKTDSLVKLKRYKTCAVGVCGLFAVHGKAYCPYHEAQRLVRKLWRSN